MPVRKRCVCQRASRKLALRLQHTAMVCHASPLVGPRPDLTLGVIHSRSEMLLRVGEHVVVAMRSTLDGVMEGARRAALFPPAASLTCRPRCGRQEWVGD